MCMHNYLKFYIVIFYNVFIKILWNKFLFLNIFFCKKRGRINWSVLRWTLQRRSSAWICTGTTLCLPSVRYHFSIRWFCIAVPDPHCHEARRHKNRQTGKIDDSHWSFFRSLHSAGADCHSLLVLRAGIFWQLDADLEHEHVYQEPLLHSLSSGHSARNKTRTRFCGVHDQVFYDHGGWNNQQFLGLVEQNPL